MKMILHCGICENCQRNRKIRMHHMKPIATKGKNGKYNRIKLCFQCERWLHFKHTNEDLAENFDTKDKIIQDFEMQMFARFLNMQQDLTPKDWSAKRIQLQFNHWKAFCI